MGNVEINEQPDLKSTEFQIGQNLSEMQGKQFLHGLDLHSDALFDNEIDAICGVKLNAAVDDWKPYLVCERNAILR